jgi:hypothetical protein
MITTAEDERDAVMMGAAFALSRALFKRDRAVDPAHIFWT